jgi:hypothetical protein
LITFIYILYNENIQKIRSISAQNARKDYSIGQRSAKRDGTRREIEAKAETEITREGEVAAVEATEYQKIKKPEDGAPSPSPSQAEIGEDGLI